MRQILITILMLSLIGCNGQAKKNNSGTNKPNDIILKFKNTSVVFEKVNTTNDSNNIQGDFIIRTNGNKTSIRQSYLESDLLDGKTIKFSNNAVSNVKITFNYDAFYYGEEKRKIALGFNRDTIITLSVINNEIKLPNFEDIKKTLIKHFEKKDVYNSAYLVNQNYFKKIIANSEGFGGTNSSEYKESVNFFKKTNKDFKNLDQLFVKIDYSKFIIEFEDKSNINAKIFFDRLFQTDESLKKISKVVDENFKIPNGFYILDSTIINLKGIKYKILTLERNEIKNKENAQHNSNPVIILEKTDNTYYKKADNYNLVFKYDDNCPADGYGGIINKNSFFTIQQIFCQDFMFVNSYITFKIEEKTNEIYLHKYGEEYTDRSNPDNKLTIKTWSIKDFGTIKFEDVNENFLKKLRIKK